MHPSVREFVTHTVDTWGLRDASVLEVGSLDVNGTVRDLFTGDYVGTDMRAGAGVDVVCDAHDLPYGDEFGVIVCTEMLEHDSQPWVSLAKMHQAGRKDAHLILTCRGYDERGCFPLHDYPSDLWRFSGEGIEHLLGHTGWTLVAVEPDPEAPGVFAHATA